jgi:hypothetical protein
MGLILMLAPAPTYSAPSLPLSKVPPNTLAPALTEPSARINQLFDLSDLPAAVAPPDERQEAPPQDPAADLRRYRYLGGARAGERNAALFEAEGVVVTLRLGETLADFTLVSFDAAEAIFRKGEFEASLQLIRQ